MVAMDAILFAFPFVSIAAIQPLWSRSQVSPSTIQVPKKLEWSTIREKMTTTTKNVEVAMVGSQLN